MKFEAAWALGGTTKMIKGPERDRGVASVIRMTSAGERGKEKMSR
jgi:hypothetical protein